MVPTAQASSVLSSAVLESPLPLMDKQSPATGHILPLTLDGVSRLPSCASKGPGHSTPSRRVR